MLKLDLKKAPRWIDLAPGVRMQVLPATMKVILQARRDPEVMAIVAGAEDDPEALEARTDVAVAVAQAVARRVVIGWEGVLDDADRPAPVAPEYIDALLEHPAVFETFQSQYLAPAMLLASEKNGSALSPSGTSAGARNTAGPAARSARRAPTKSTGRKPSKAR